MPNNIFFNSKLAEDFKQEINFKAIESKVSDDQKVVMDWTTLLSEIVIDDTHWSMPETQGSLAGPDTANVDGYLENGEEYIGVSIYSFSSIDNKAVLNRAVEMASLISAPKIMMKLDPKGPCDLNLYLDDGSGGKATHSQCVYKNIIVEVKTSYSSLDSRTVVNYIAKKMQTSLVETKCVPKNEFKIAPEKIKVKVGEVFPVDITASDDYIHNNGDYPDGLSQESFTDGKYIIKAEAKGVYRIPFGISHKRTLVSDVVYVDVEVVSN